VQGFDAGSNFYRLGHLLLMAGHRLRNYSNIQVFFTFFFANSRKLMMICE